MASFAWSSSVCSDELASQFHEVGFLVIGFPVNSRNGWTGQFLG